MKALIFDCDGVLVDTERDGHRVAFNQAFTNMGFKFQWGVSFYGELLKIAGGKERLRYYFDQYGWPEGTTDKDTLIRDLHRNKTDLFLKIIEQGKLPLRTGVKRIIDEAINLRLNLAICSTSNERAVNLIADTLLGKERRSCFDAILAGDVVSKKKPDPEIYLLVQKKLGLNGGECVVIEDSRNGLLAAKGAGMCCVITKSRYTGNEEFKEADAVYPELGDPPTVQATLYAISKLCPD